MNCRECGLSTAQRVRVEYADQEEMVVALCPDCREDYAQGGLVQKVEPFD